jgi:hypothetical protein
MAFSVSSELFRIPMRLTEGRFACTVENLLMPADEENLTAPVYTFYCFHIEPPDPGVGDP